jgi:hypothetical protein
MPATLVAGISMNTSAEFAVPGYRDFPLALIPAQRCRPAAPRCAAGPVDRREDVLLLVGVRSSNFLPNIVSEPGAHASWRTSSDLQADATGDDFSSGSRWCRRRSIEHGWITQRAHHIRPQNKADWESVLVVAVAILHDINAAFCWRAPMNQGWALVWFLENFNS